jgi:mannose-6-phosphate isomerase-like protein (cupin superfamily)
MSNSARRVQRIVVLIAVLATGVYASSCHRSQPRPGARLLVSADAGAGAIDVDAFLAAHPMPRDVPVHAIEVGRTPAASHHVVQVRGSESPHVHRAHDVTVIVLRGEGVLTLGARQLSVRAGDVMLIPRATPHFFRNTGRAPAVAFAIFSPAFDGADSIPLEP